MGERRHVTMRADCGRRRARGRRDAGPEPWSRRAWAVSPATGGYCGQPRVNDVGESERRSIKRTHKADAYQFPLSSA